MMIYDESAAFSPADSSGIEVYLVPFNLHLFLINSVFSTFTKKRQTYHTIQFHMNVEFKSLGQQKCCSKIILKPD